MYERFVRNHGDREGILANRWTHLHRKRRDLAVVVVEEVVEAGEAGMGPHEVASGAEAAFMAEQRHTINVL